MLRPIINKKAQVEFSPAIVIAVIIGLVILAPIMIRIIGTVTGTFFTQMNETAPSAVAEASSAVDKVYNFFDYLIIIAIFINIIVLFISAWFIDTNPVFIILYIMFAFIFVLFLPNLMDAVDRVWEKMEDVDQDPWRDGSMNLTFTDWVRQNLIMVSVVVIALSGIITYAKFKLNSGGQY
jgi:uncharacterized membrane-anchored protein YitT (DUF2179 family)